MSLLGWLTQRAELVMPTYNVRINARAKRMRLKVDALGKVEVVIPRESHRRLVAGFVAEHDAWLKRTVARMLATRAQVSGLDDPVPGLIEFPALGECWVVTHGVEFPLKIRQAEGENGLLTLRVGGTPEVARTTLRKWLSRRAGPVLSQWLAEVSRETGLEYARVTIRGQRTRWGSCSARKSINLNRNLLFVRPEAVRYLLVHELSHTKHLNHGARFWNLVGQHVPDYPVFEAELNRASRLVPSWAVE